jgi:hypothetical protein
LSLLSASGNIDVFGAAEISGIAGWIAAHLNSFVAVSVINKGISPSTD